MNHSCTLGALGTCRQCTQGHQDLSTCSDSDGVCHRASEHVRQGCECKLRPDEGGLTRQSKDVPFTEPLKVSVCGWCKEGRAGEDRWWGRPRKQPLWISGGAMKLVPEQ